MKSKAEMMARLRKERKDKGLVEFRAWVTPKQKQALEKLLQKLS